MKVSLKEFAQMGKFGSIELGMDRSTVEHLLGSPDNWEVSPDRQIATIWKYGDIDFYFYKHALFMIIIENFSSFKGGSRIELDAWIISASLTGLEAEQALVATDIPYQKQNLCENDNGFRLLTGGGTGLVFWGEGSLLPTLQVVNYRTRSRP